MPRPPSIQWYYKQWLGDNKVLAMDWDAKAMHFQLLMMSIQENPPGSIPNDMAAIRRWLMLSPYASERCQGVPETDSGHRCYCSDCVWRRVRPQILAAWTLQDDRWVNSGMVEACQRRENYKSRSGVREKYQTGTKNPPDPMKTVNEVVFDVGSKELSRIEVALIVQQQCHISGRHFNDVMEKQFQTFSLGNPLKIAAEQMIASINRYKELGGKKVYFFLAEGEWLNDESSWFGQAKKSGQQERQQRNRDGLTAALRNRYGADGGESSSKTGEGTDDRGIGGLGRAVGAGTGTGD